MARSEQPSQSDFILECQRLHQLHLEALASGDRDRIEGAIDDFTRFLRMNQVGRLQEYFALRRAEQV